MKAQKKAKRIEIKHRGPALKAVPKLLKLDLGCGSNPKPGFLGVDICETPEAKYVWDLSKAPWPFKDNSVEEAYCQQFFEHLDGHGRVTFMNELYRVLAPEAKAAIITPYYSSMRASQDVTHMWPPVSESSFFYYNEGWRYINSLEHTKVFPICKCGKDKPVMYNCNFDFGYGFNFLPEVFVKSDEVKRFHAAFYNNAVTDIMVTVTKKPRLTPEEKAKLPKPKIGQHAPELAKQ